MEFIKDAYPYLFEGISNGVYSYRFISTVGGNEIVKIVMLRPIEGYLHLYNLGFGNLEESDNGEKNINDSSESNNNDYDKVLASVFSCVIHFMSDNPQSQVIFFGNTEHKHLLYKRKIAANLEALCELFVIHGGFARYDLETVTKTQKLKRKGKMIERKIKLKNVETLRIHEVGPIEYFNRQNSRLYDFVLISLNDIL